MESSWYDRYLRLFINPIADICGAGILAIILAFAYISFSHKESVMQSQPLAPEKINSCTILLKTGQSLQDSIFFQYNNLKEKRTNK